MPIHVPPVSRRSFLTTAASAGLGVMSWSILRETALGAGTDPDFFALLSDTHIPERPDVTARDTNMTANLKKVVADLGALKRRPAGVLINGDCAYLKGLPADYRNLADCLAPLGDWQMPVHLTMGNHDDRGPLYEALAKQRPANPPVMSKHVGVIETTHANWFLLDSLSEVNVVTGLLGEEQLRWLAGTLDARPGKPALVVAHHNPQFTPPKEGQAWGGIRDTAALFQLLTARPHVKAFVFGHTHTWKLDQHETIRLINLPPVAYIFAAGQPNGWVEAHLHSSGMRLKLKTHDPQHPRADEQVDLAWT